MNHLVVFTGGYPYGNGETFIESEIDYLANAFNNVTIISVTNKKS